MCRDYGPAPNPTENGKDRNAQKEMKLENKRMKALFAAANNIDLKHVC